MVDIKAVAFMRIDGRVVQVFQNLYHSFFSFAIQEHVQCSIYYKCNKYNNRLISWDVVNMKNTVDGRQHKCPSLIKM